MASKIIPVEVQIMSTGKTSLLYVSDELRQALVKNGEVVTPLVAMTPERVAALRNYINGYQRLARKAGQSGLFDDDYYTLCAMLAEAPAPAASSEKG